MKKQRYQRLTPKNCGAKGTGTRIRKAKEIANMEIEAKAQGKAVAQLIVEQWK